MAQFDLYPNPNVAQREAYPFLVVMQNDQLAHHNTRLVMPLARLPRPPVRAPRRLSQPVVVDAVTLYPAAHLCAALPVRLLGHPLRSLADQQAILRDALDAVISGV